MSIILLLAQKAGICQVTTNTAGASTISYTSFTINSGVKGIMIDWSVADPDKANYFEIQRSTDGKDFRTVAMVLGPDPRQPSGDQYECIDKAAKKNKKYFYRLKHVSVNGDAELSQTKELAL
ncbi:MAG TPA: hypothetical protein VG847_10765 [Chitinophagaceae bacterium]|nr:hypothetical protein [Chitinophagaceae bacterium]